MATIKFDIEYSDNNNFKEEIRKSKDVFKSSLEKNEILKAHDAEITLTNKDKQNSTKFVLTKVTPENKFMETQRLLISCFSEHLYR